MKSFIQYMAEKKIELPKSKTPITGIFNNPNMDVIGTGVQSTVYSMKSHPNSVLKVVNVMGDNDPTIQFLRVCTNHQDNPYFPKIFSYKLYDAKDLSQDDIDYLRNNLEFKQYRSKTILLISMEKLDRIFDFNAERIVRMLQILKLTATDYVNYSEPLLIMQDWFKDPKMRKKMMNNTPDPKLKDALRILEPLFNRFKADVHGNNVMIRTDGKRIHLVLSDPIWML